MLLGREAELSRIDGLLADARESRSGVLVISGEPGIGKSSLLSYAAAQAAKANEWLVLRASGVESEAELPFAALDQLLRPVLNGLPQIPEAQAKALQAALALGAPAPQDRFTAAAATVSLLAVAADAHPVLCIVDDAQWLDADSSTALVFACRRLQAERIVALFATRDTEPGTIIAAGLPELRLSGLDSSAANAIISRTTVGLAPSVRSRLIEIAHGNPLALFELPAALSQGQRTGRDTIGEPMPVGRRIERAFVGRSHALPIDTQRALVLAAACDTDDLPTLMASLAGIGLTAQALEPAEAAGLFGLGDGWFAFRHPLVRSALYQAASAPERRAAHRAIADALAGEDQRARRAWHLADSMIGSNENAAAELDAIGKEARLRGGYATAATTFERAARMTIQGPVRARRLLAAGEAFWMAGQSDRANALLAGAVGLTVDPLLRAEIQQLWGRVSMWTGAVLEAHRRLREEAERVEPVDAARASLLMAEAVLPCLMAGDIRLALRTAERAMGLAQPVGGFPAVIAALALGQALLLRGETSRARSLLEEARLALGSTDPFGPGAILTQIASCFVWIEEYEQARTILSSVVEAARAQGAIVILPFALATLSEYDFRLGNFPSAYANASESVTLAIQTNQDAEAPFSYVTLARSEAVLGHDEACRAHVMTALQLADKLGAGSLRTYASSTLGLLELGRGRPDLALTFLGPLPQLVIEQGLEEPGTVQWAPDLVESYVQLGRADDARNALAVFVAAAENTERTWALAASARCRGLLASAANFEGEFEAALRWHEHTETPFERARTQLSYGERLRRAGQRRKARERLHLAMDAFVRLGAEPWTKRAALELRASGERLRQREDTATMDLTAQEIQVAMIVAGGATNREAAAHLFVSPKTIEFHLGHIFRKLGLRSRSELAHRVATKSWPVQADSR